MRSSQSPTLRTMLIISVLLIIIAIVMLINVLFILPKYQEITEGIYNPSSLSSRVDLNSIFNTYMQLLNLIVMKNYNESLEMLSYVNESAISSLTPFNNINVMTVDLIQQLSLLDEDLNNLNTYTGNVNETLYMAYKVANLINYIQSSTVTSLSHQIEQLCLFIAASTGYPLPPLTVILRTPSILTYNECFEGFSETLNVISLELNYKYNLLNRFIDLLKTEMTSGKIHVYIHVYLPSSGYYVGSTVTINGRLSLYNGTGLSNATIYVLTINDKVVAITTTNNTGFFSVNITLPYIYSKRITYVFEYAPPQNSEYLPTVSFVTLNLIYYNTTVYVQMPSEILWGSYMDVSGFVTGPGNRTITIRLGNLLINTLTNNSGYFSIPINTSGLVPGNYTCIVYVQPSGIYAPAVFNTTVSIVSLPTSLYVSVRNNSITFAGFKTNMYAVVMGLINGINLSRPWNIIITANGVNKTVSFTGSTLNSAYEFSLSTPMGFRYLTIYLEPNPPYDGTEVVVRVFVINLLEVFVIALIPMLSITVIYKSRGKVAEGTQVMEERVSVFRPRIERLIWEFMNIRDRLHDELALKIYDNYTYMLNGLINKYSISTERNMTLRETVMRLKDHVNVKRYETLWEVTLFIEKLLYSDYKPTPQDLELLLNYIRYILGDVS